MVPLTFKSRLHRSLNRSSIITGFFVVSAFLLACQSISAQHLNVMISDVKDPNEMSISINPTNPFNMVAGANIASVYQTRDGGLSWERQDQKSSHGVWGDPVIITDTAGSFYHFHLSNTPGAKFIDRIVCQRSDDGGQTFNDGSYFGLNGTKAQDKPWGVVNPFNNEIYATWTQFDKYNSPDPNDFSNILFTKSSDRGETWSEPIQINSVSGDCLDDDNTVEGAVPAVGPNGEIYVAWSGPNGLVFNRSEDGGKTWLENEIRIGEHPGGWAIDIPGIYRANGMPVTKCDLSDGPHRGTIYVNWADQRNGVDDTDIYLSKSTDKGQTWSAPTRVNDDTTKTHQFFTWMDIDYATGYVYFVFHDRREHSDEHTDVYMAWSTDGGRGFKNVRISDSPFLPNKEVFFGDYNNIWAQDGVVRPVWTRLDGRDLSVWTALVDNDLLLNPQNKAMEAQFAPDGKSLGISLSGPGKYDVALGLLNTDPITLITQVELAEGPNDISLPEVPEPGIYGIEITDGHSTYHRQVVWMGAGE